MSFLDEDSLPFRVQQYWSQNSDNQVTGTNDVIRNRLSKESLQQRLIEIQHKVIEFDQQLTDNIEQHKLFIHISLNTNHTYHAL